MSTNGDFSQDASDGRKTILYVDGVGPFGGASRSLFELLNAGDRKRFRRLFLVQKGTASEFYRKVGDGFVASTGISRFDNTRFSHYRGVRWIVVLREIAYIPFTLIALIRARMAWREVDLVHANEILEIFPAILASLLFRAPLVVHVRSLQRRDWRSLRTRLLHALLRRFANRIITIDEGVRATLPPDLPVTVIHNSFTPEPAAERDTRLRNRIAELTTSDALAIGFVGNLHASKGIDAVVDAAEILEADGRSVVFLIVGGHTSQASGLKWRILNLLGLAQNRGDAILERLATSPARAQLHLLGATPDIDALYSAIDVNLFPSHFDAPGRPVFEAAFYGVPSIVAVRDPRPDTLVDGGTGIAIADPDGELLARAIAKLDDDREAMRKLGAAAKDLAERNFSPRTNSSQMEEIYDAVLREGPVWRRRS